MYFLIMEFGLLVAIFTLIFRESSSDKLSYISVSDNFALDAIRQTTSNWCSAPSIIKFTASPCIHISCQTGQFFIYIYIFFSFSHFLLLSHELILSTEVECLHRLQSLRFGDSCGNFSYFLDFLFSKAWLLHRIII